MSGFGESLDRKQHKLSTDSENRKVIFAALIARASDDTDTGYANLPAWIFAFPFQRPQRLRPAMPHHNGAGRCTKVRRTKCRYARRANHKAFNSAEATPWRIPLETSAEHQTIHQTASLACKRRSKQGSLVGIRLMQLAKIICHKHNAGAR